MLDHSDKFLVHLDCPHTRGEPGAPQNLETFQAMRLIPRLSTMAY
jgi:hypothetical protein